MPASRIAALFDAENCAADLAAPVLQQLSLRGTVSIRRAIGDFSGNLLAPWVAQARLCGIELILQPSLGKGKNSADILLAVEAMDILHAGGVGTIALVSSDRDFTPLALRLRGRGLEVLGFGRAGTDGAFQAACSQFFVLGAAPRVAAVAQPKTAPPPAKVALVHLSAEEKMCLLQAAQTACRTAGGPIAHLALRNAIITADPALATKLSGSGKFLKTLVAHSIVERVGAGPDLRLQPAKLRSA